MPWPVPQADQRDQRDRREWPIGLDVARLRASGWQPTPIRELVVKVHNRCNLACDHCYMYEAQDTSWRVRPAAMATKTMLATADRIAEHAEQHDLPTVRVVFHGGEPLLAGARFLGEAAGALRARMPPRTHVELTVQTNGVHLTDDVLGILLDHRINVGVSLDGGRTAHNRHRHSANGRGSYDTVSAAVHRLRQPPHRDIYAGLLCTIDLENDPVETYEALLGFDPPRLDFLLPHGNWTHPPPGRQAADPSATPYADWLIAAFDRWYEPARRETSVRVFEEIMSLCLGGPSRSEAIGLSPVSLLVIDTDGSIEQVDALRSAYDGAAATGLDVFSHSFDTALTYPAVVARQIGAEALCATCQRCVVRDICGGGLYAHRYRAGTGYLNPSVYCADLLRLIQHVHGCVVPDADALRNQ